MIENVSFLFQMFYWYIKLYTIHEYYFDLIGIHHQKLLVFHVKDDIRVKQSYKLTYLLFIIVEKNVYLRLQNCIVINNSKIKLLALR